MKSQHKTLVISLFVAINLMFATSYAQNTSLPVGAIPGSADVTAMGAATYNIPIEVVPGTQGVQPNLSVVYNSMANMGILGSQWDLGGLSAITRVGQNKFLDSQSSSVMLENSDRFALDGNRLVCANDAMYGYPGIELLPEFEDFSKIIPYGAAGNGPSFFKVYRDDGSVAEYGNSADSKQKLDNNVYSWYINKITDINGNYMTFTYGYSGSEIWIDHIDYTGNSAASLSPYARVKFSYDVLSNMGSTFVAGYEIPQRRLLRTITVQYKNGSSYEMVRQYQFTYSNESPKRLTKVQLMASDSSALNPTSVEWNTLTYGTPTTSQLSVPNMVFDEGTAHFALDFNGDGLSDILEYNRYHRRILLNQNNTFQEDFADPLSQNQYIFSVVPADLVGDGYSEVITTYYDSPERELSVTALVSSQNEVTLLQLSNVDSVKTVLAGDFYGDGTHQLLICYNQNNVLLYRINRQTEVTIDHSIGKFELLDYDGDGQTEFALVKNSTMSVYKYNPATEHIECISNDYQFYKKPLAFGDFNGDGFSDYIYLVSGNNYGCALGNGNGFFEQIPLSRQLTNDTLSPILLDINNDGFSDILTFRKIPNGSLKLFVYLGKGYYSDSVQLFFNQSWITFSYVMPRKSVYGNNPVPDLFNLVIGNFNSDKRLDFLVAWQYEVNSQLTLYEFNENKTKCHVNKITQGDGSYVQWQHQDIQGYYYQYASFIKPLPYYFDVVKTMRASGDRPSRRNVYHYQFKDPQYSFRRHSVLGFSTITQVDSVRNASDTVHLANLQANGVWQDVLMPVKKRVRIGYNITQDVTYSPTIHVLAQNRRLPLIYRSVSHDNLSLTSVTQHNTVNSEGHLVGTSTLTKDINGTGFLTKDSVCYHFSTINLSNGGFTTHTDSSVTYSFFGNSTEFFTKKQSFTYYSNGRLLSSSRLCDGVTNTVTYNTYDMFGNVKSETSSATGCESRSVSRLFDATGRFCVTEYNAMSHVKRAINDPRTGLVLSSTDVNQLTTTYSYDAFGKLISVHHPDGNTDTIRYGWYTGNEIPYAKYYTLTHIPGKTFDTERYYDLLGRNICTRENGMFTDIQYNTKGLVEKVSKPYIRNTPNNQKIWHIMHYDSYGRIETESDTYSNLSYSYYGRTTTITDNLRQVSSSKTTDAAGRVILASDQGGQIQYEYAITTHNGYNVLNTAVTTNGHTTSMWTDQRGNRIRLQDPDAGTTVYDYNAFGELVRQVNAKGDTLKMSYDKLGRVVQKQYIDSLGVIRSMCYFYDNQDHNNKGKGKLSRVTVDGVNAEQYTYDTLSRPAQHTRYIDGATFQESYTYNTYGQLATLTYPDGFAVDYTYTGKGYLEEIKNHANHNNIFSAYTHNLYGQPTKCGYGNATATIYDYNAAGLMTRMFTGLKHYGMVPNPHDSLIPLSFPTDLDGVADINELDDMDILIEEPFTVDSTIQNFRYTYDNMGRLTQRMQKNSQYETFQYDNMDRLTSFTQGNGISRPSTFTTTYDSQGNILSNTLAGTYSYDSGKPHAVTEVTPSNAFPNAISAADCETNYNVFNQPSRIAEGDVEILLEYGADNQRVKAVFKDHGHTLYTRYYVNANYEVEVDAAGVVTHYNYIYGSTGLAAICVHRNGVDSMYYVHPDRLGSYTHITNSNQQVIRNLHFDPWGNVKSDTDWKEFARGEPGELAGTFRFPRGFTGHEHYADLKIINMNGRLYDPVIARFFSPDNFVQAPGFTQSYNRYSYCLNNPLQYTDPSGESFISDFLYGICNFLTLPARAITESVSWLNDHINGNVKADGYFHSDYLFNSAPPHYIDYQNVINLQNPYVYSFYEPDMMTDADGTTYRTEYYWTAVGAGGTYNLTFANQTFSGTFGPYKEYIQWHTREVPVENETTRLHLQPMFMFSSSVNISLNCFSVGNGAKTNLIETAARYNFSDNQMWHQFIGLDKAERASRYEKALGKTMGKYLTASKYAGVTVSAISALTETYDFFSYSAYNGFRWDVSVKYSLDMAMLLVGTFCGPIGFAVSTTYFIIDVSTDGFGGFGKMY